jgi:hypothetical protein
MNKEYSDLLAGKGEERAAAPITTVNVEMTKKKKTVQVCEFDQVGRETEKEIRAS